jgi:hypothetical protein
MIDPHHNPDATKTPAAWLRQARDAYEHAALIAANARGRLLTEAEARSLAFWQARGDEALAMAGAGVAAKEVGA